MSKSNGTGAGEERPVIRDVLYPALKDRGMNVVALEAATGIDRGTLSRVANNKLAYTLTRETFARVLAGIEGLTVDERDRLYRAAGFVTPDIEEAFAASGTTARLIRLVVKMSKKRQLRLLAELED